MSETEALFGVLRQSADAGCAAAIEGAVANAINDSRLQASLSCSPISRALPHSTSAWAIWSLTISTASISAYCASSIGEPRIDLRQKIVRFTDNLLHTDSLNLAGASTGTKPGRRVTDFLRRGQMRFLLRQHLHHYRAEFGGAGRHCQAVGAHNFGFLRRTVTGGGNDRSSMTHAPALRRG